MRKNMSTLAGYIPTLSEMSQYLPSSKGLAPYALAASLVLGAYGCSSAPVNVPATAPAKSAATESSQKPSPSLEKKVVVEVAKPATPAQSESSTGTKPQVYGAQPEPTTKPASAKPVQKKAYSLPQSDKIGDVDIVFLDQSHYAGPVGENNLSVMILEREGPTFKVGDAKEKGEKGLSISDGAKQLYFVREDTTGVGYFSKPTKPQPRGPGRQPMIIEDCDDHLPKGEFGLRGFMGDRDMKFYLVPLKKTDVTATGLTPDRIKESRVSQVALVDQEDLSCQISSGDPNAAGNLEVELFGNVWTLRNNPNYIPRKEKTVAPPAEVRETQSLEAELLPPPGQPTQPEAPVNPPRK